jgi:hypothetical protein
MSPKHALHVALCIAAAAFAIGFVVPDFVSVPVFWYRPVARSWAFDVRPVGLAMDFYGRCVLAAMISMTVGGASYWVARRLPDRERNASTITVLTALTLIIVFVVMAFFAWRLSHLVLAAHVAGGS